MESGRGWKDKHCKVCISVARIEPEKNAAEEVKTDISGIFKIYVSVDKK